MLARLLLFLLLAPLAHAQDGGAAEVAPDTTSRWIDPDDGWLDLSSFLAHPAGFVPLVVPITEPALGYGVGGALVFLDPREDAGAAGWARPNITAVGGMWTEGGSEGGFAGNSSLWSDGTLQTLVGGGALSLDLELHGIGADDALEDDPRDYTLDVLGLIGEGRTRLGESDFWLALRFAWAETTVDFEGDFPAGEGLDPSDDDVVLAGPTLTVRHDSLDNLFTPTRGTLSDSMVSAFDEAFGGSQDFQLVQQVLVRHQPLAESLFLGARLDLDLSFGETPFYARPYVDLRGVPALRYQGEHALSTELELRWQFHPRFGLVGFGGYGIAWTDLDGFEREQEAFTEGAGFRYLLARRFGLHMGLDVARGPEEGALYVQLGNAWLRP